MNSVPLIIGVTGHRDLVDDETDAIASRIRGLFEYLRAQYPDLPLLVMTPLAEGADRLAALVAHEMDIPTLGLLPMPKALYATDFEEASRDHFDDLLSLTDEVVELPLLPGVSEAEVAENGSARDKQYAQLGAYLAAHSHILLAIWDGKPSMAPGGTAHVIKFHQHDVIDLISAGQHRSPIDFTEDESDLVYHVICSRRVGSPEEGLVAGEAAWFTRDEVEPRTKAMPERYDLVFARMAEFSSDVSSVVGTSDGETLVPEDDLRTCSEAQRGIEQLYREADYLARRFQGFFLSSLRWTTGFALTAGFSFVAFADLPNLEFMIFAYIGTICLVLVSNWLEGKNGWQRKYQDYRMLAEGLRVQFYWSLAGVKSGNPSRFSHDSFLRRQDLELGWIRNVMRFAGYKGDADPAPPSAERFRQVVEIWVHGQLGYYRSKMLERGQRHRVTGRINGVSFAIVLVLAVVLSVMQFFDAEAGADIMIAIMGLLPFVVAARQNYAYRIAERELVAQYQHTLRILENANKLLERADSLETQVEILRALGEAALEENGQWILRQRERPLLSSSALQG